MNERIKTIRINAGLTQQQFADRIKVKRNTVATYEMGRSIPSDSAIALICREFGINEEWLRNGIEPIYVQSSTFSLDEFVKSRGASDLELDIMKAYFDLEPDVRKMIIEHFKSRLATPKRDLFDNVPDTPEELEKRFPPVDPDDKNVAG
ncbi:helix-turn-helix transcriptional regulator [Roseburia intestinalis]|uniref:helix-turn-helix transcriptional regulator n=1 Tax=Roseburia intestinalis TaxID=166486 RepID=UPI000E4976CE|nr:helix-turn-helix transcriptional regulator [Roseburia intestinalis]RHM05952.1 XRE family transcriptional regulator [Roseburia intestinalis]